MRYVLLMLVMGQTVFEVTNRCQSFVVVNKVQTEVVIEAYAPTWCSACPAWKAKLGDKVKWINGEHPKGRAVMYPCFVVKGKVLLTELVEYEALSKLPAGDVLAVLRERGKTTQ